MRREQNSTVQNRTEQNRTEQNRTEQNRAEQYTVAGLPRALRLPLLLMFEPYRHRQLSVHVAHGVHRPAFHN